MITKLCKCCGVLHFGPKQDFKIQEFPGQEPLIIFDCDCGSTLSWPIDLRVSAMILKRLEKGEDFCKEVLSAIKV